MLSNLLELIHIVSGLTVVIGEYSSRWGTGHLNCRGSPEELTEPTEAMWAWPDACRRGLASLWADSEPDTFAQEIYWRGLLGTLYVRGPKKLDWAEEEMNCGGYSKGFIAIRGVIRSWGGSSEGSSIKPPCGEHCPGEAALLAVGVILASNLKWHLSRTSQRTRMSLLCYPS